MSIRYANVRTVVAVAAVAFISLSACGVSSSPDASADLPAPSASIEQATQGEDSDPGPTATASPRESPSPAPTEAPTPAPTEPPTTSPTTTAAPTLLIDQVVDIGDTTRNYHLFAPEGVEAPPLIVLLHENRSSPDALLGLNGEAAPFGVWLDIAEREGLAVIAPQGRGGWNDCRGDASGNPPDDDVAFLLAVIDDVVASHGVDPARVFATGFSNGGHMSIRLAEEAPDRIAGFAAISAADAADSECTTSQIPVPALFMNGSGDVLMPFDGGAMANGATVYSSADTVARWVERNGAEQPSSEAFDDLDPDDGSTVTVTRYTAAADAAPVTLYAVDGGGHSPPSVTEQLVNERPIRGRQNHDIEMAEEVWGFFAEIDV